MVKMIDDNVGTLMKLIDSLGLAKNTLIIYGADNGHRLYYEGKREQFDNITTAFRSVDGGDLFKFAVNGITYKYETSDIMGMDAVFVHMAQTYYCPSDGSKSRVDWMTPEKMDKLCERARKEAPLIIGAQGKDSNHTDTTETN